MLLLPVVLVVAVTCCRLPPCTAALAGRPTALRPHPTLRPPPHGADHVPRTPVGLERVAACRASCALMLPKWPPTDETCFAELQCVTCWHMCGLLYEANVTIRQTCNKDTCFIGCQIACDFDFSQTSELPGSNEWRFPSIPVLTVVNAAKLFLKWSRESPGLPPGGSPTVYTLLFKDANTPRWHQVVSTMNVETMLVGRHTDVPGLRFQLVASSAHGTCGRVFINHPGSASTERRPTLLPAVTPRSAPVLSWGVEASSAMMSSPKIETEVTGTGRVEAVVTWEQTNSDTDRRHVYTVAWRRHSCNVDHRMAFCPLPENELSANFKAKHTQRMRLVLTRLTFNSEYWLEVTLRGRVRRAVFFTPACHHVDATFEQCPGRHTAAPSVVRTTTPALVAASRETVSSRPPTADGAIYAARSKLQQAGLSSWWSSNWSVVVEATAGSLSCVSVVMAGVWLCRCFSRRRRDGYQKARHEDPSFSSVPSRHASLVDLPHVPLSQRLLTFSPVLGPPGCTPPHGATAVTPRCSPTAGRTMGRHVTPGDVQYDFRRPVPQEDRLSARVVSLLFSDEEGHESPARTSTPVSAAAGRTSTPISAAAGRTSMPISAAAGRTSTPVTGITLPAVSLRLGSPVDHPADGIRAAGPTGTWPMYSSLTAASQTTPYSQLCFIEDDSSTEDS